MDARQWTVVVFRSELTLDAIATAGDDRVRHVKDLLGRAVVVVELHFGGSGVVADEVAQIADIRRAPRIDRLIRVADDGQIAAPARPGARQLVLDGGGVLELVDQHVVKALLVMRTHVVDFKELQGSQEQVVEVQCLRLLQRRPVPFPDSRRNLVEVAACGRRELLKRRARALAVRNAAQHRARRVLLRVELQVFQCGAHDLHLVVVVEDLELAGDADRITVRAQHPHADSVKRAQPDLIALGFSDQLLQSPAHFSRGAVREGDRENSPGGDTLNLNQPCDPVRNDAGLAGSRAGDDQQRAVGLRNGFALGIVELIEVERSVCGHLGEHTCVVGI